MSGRKHRPTARERNARREMVPFAKVESFLAEYMLARPRPEWRVLAKGVVKRFVLPGPTVGPQDLDDYVSRLVAERRVGDLFADWWSAFFAGETEEATDLSKRVPEAVLVASDGVTRMREQLIDGAAQLRQAQDKCAGLSAELEALRERCGRCPELDRAFVEIARIHLAEVTFNRIMDRARERAAHGWAIEHPEHRR